MRVELKLRKEVGQRDAQKRASRERKCSGCNDAAAPGANSDMPITKRATPSGIISPNPRLTRCTNQRADPPRTISVEIVSASAGLCTRVASNTPIPAAPSPRCSWKSAATALARATPPTSE